MSSFVSAPLKKGEKLFHNTMSLGVLRIQKEKITLYPPLKGVV